MNRTPQSNALTALLPLRIAAQWRMKLAMALVMPAIFLPIYFTLQRIDVFPPRTLSLTIIDDWAGFDPAWIWCYISQYVIIPVPPLLANQRDQLRRLIVGIAVTSALAFVVFFFLPVHCPRPTAAEIAAANTNFAYDWILSVDTTGNAFPSLHVGLSAFVAMYAHHVIDADFSRRVRLGFLTLLWVWTLAIAWSTMATKQHYFWDVVGGFAIAYAGYRIAYRGVKEDGLHRA